ncbi:MAG: CDP-abequose synthase [Syntrophomonadaceae bacterium]|nr:CDP-abequose synthase [Bacillota bacterium]
MMKKVFLTGASGFIGRQTIPLLIQSGYEVHAVYHTAQPSIKQDRYLFWHQCNLLNTNEQKCLLAEVKPTHLLHFAWYATPGKYWTSLENLRWLQASLGLLMTFVDQGGKRAVLAGTCAEYDWSYGYCSEKVTPMQPATLYGTCKHSLQEILRHLSRQTRLSSAWGRIFFLYGPHEHPSRLVSSVIRALLQGQPAPCSHGNQIRDFLYVQDVADAFVALLETDVSGPVNIASGCPVTLKEVINKIDAKVQRERELIRFGEIPVSSSEPPLLVADTRRLFEEVGWQPKYDLHRGLEHTIAWWKNQLLLEEAI